MTTPPDNPDTPTPGSSEQETPRAVHGRRAAALLEISLIGDELSAKLAAEALTEPGSSEPPAAVTWESLTEGEREALREFLTSSDVNDGVWMSLESKKLVSWGGILTDLGKRVLAQKPQAVPTTAGSETVTAATFYNEHYAEKIKRYECEVIWFEDNSRIERLRKMGVTPTEYEVSFVNEPGTWAQVGSEREFTVRWLTPQTPPRPVDGEVTGEGTGSLRRLSVLSEQLLNDTSSDLEEAQDTIAELEARLLASHRENEALKALCAKAADNLALPNLGYNSPLGLFVKELRTAAALTTPPTGDGLAEGDGGES